MTPEKIGRYVVEGEIGRGGMATVFKAFDPRFDRIVAIKILPREFLHDPEFRARFEREAKTIATLEHSAIVPVYDYGEQDGQLYLVMRYMPGGSLADRLQDGPISVDQAAEVIKRMGAALDSAHKKGIIHRDLKPGNILLDQHGDAYLADFGIAHLASAQTALTASGRLVGTPTYMSPEQVYGDKALDGRSDIYALGVILFQMLTGEVPFRADTPAKVMMKHVMDPVPNILDEKPELPIACENVIRTAMAKERDERFSTVTDMATALTAVSRNLTRPEWPVLDTAVSRNPEPTIPATPEPPAASIAPTIELPQSTTPELKPQTVPVWAWVLSGLFIIIIIGAVGYGILALTGNNPLASDDPTATPVLEATAEEVVPTATPMVIAEAPTATQESAPEPTEKPTEASTETAVPEPTDDGNIGTKEANAIATRRAEEIASATQEAVLEATSNAIANPPATTAPALPPAAIRPEFGPLDGSIIHELDDRAESEFAEVNIRDFIAETTFTNPYAGEGWDFGITFRQVDANQELRLVVRSDGYWSLNNRQNSEDSFIHEGDVSQFLNLREGSQHKITLIATDNVGYFLLNEQFISVLDLSSRTDLGDVAISTGYYFDSERAGAETTFQGFTVWSLNPTFGPQNGELDHVIDDLVKSASSNQDITNFIVESTFINPFSPNDALWDYGFAFRQTAVNDQFWLVLRGDGEWLLRNRVNGEEVELETGVFNGLDISANGNNQLTLIAWGDDGYFLLNGTFVTKLNLSERTDSGDIKVITAFFLDSEIEGFTTGYDQFTVWPLP